MGGGGGGADGGVPVFHDKSSTSLKGLYLHYPVKRR